MWVTVDFDAPEWSIPQLRIVSNNSIFDLLDIEQVGALLEGISDIVDVDVEKLLQTPRVLEVGARLIANASLTLVVKTLRSFLQLLVDFSFWQTDSRNKELFEVPLKDLLIVAQHQL